MGGLVVLIPESTRKDRGGDAKAKPVDAVSSNTDTPALEAVKAGSARAWAATLCVVRTGL